MILKNNRRLWGDLVIDSMKSNIPSALLKILSRNNRPLYDDRNPLNHCWKGISTYLSKELEILSAKDFPLSSNTLKCFDSLLFPQNHPGRLRDNTYYLDDNRILRPHMTLYTPDLLKERDSFLICGEVFRRDKVDRTHFPIFHQIEAAKTFKVFEEEIIIADMHKTIDGLLSFILGEDMKWRWVKASFPFTEPSWEVEVCEHQPNGDSEWIEILGCGLLKNGLSSKAAWAFGIGLERMAMLRHSINDIRLFWSEDDRFLGQFKIDDNMVTKYKAFSKYPPIYRDISFFTKKEKFTENDLMEIIREQESKRDDGGLVEDVRLLDSWKNSLCYRITFRSMNRTLTDIDDVNPFMSALHQSMGSIVDLRL